MPIADSNGFDVFQHRDQMKTTRDRAASARRILKRTAGLLILSAAFVLTMHAIGGVGQFSHWMEIRRHLSVISQGTAGPDSQKSLFSLAKAIPDRRGNHSALAGLYCVVALRRLGTDGLGEAQPVLDILESQFASERLFSDHWRQANFVERCQACPGPNQPRTCSACNGSGKSPSQGSKLRSSASRSKRSLGTQTCLVCKGRGKVAGRRASVCRQCRGKGTVLSQTVVQEHIDKALTKARLLANLKCAQSALSLHFLADIKANTKSRSKPKGTPGIADTGRKMLADKLDAVLTQRSKQHAALVATYKAAVHDIVETSSGATRLATLADSLNDETTILPDALIMEPRLKEQNTEFMKKLETLQTESSATEKALYDTYLAGIRQSQSVGRLTGSIADFERDRIKSDPRYKAVEFENALCNTATNSNGALERLVEIWNREQLSLDIDAARCEKAVHAKYTSALGSILASVQESGDLDAWEGVNKTHQAALATNRLSSIRPSIPVAAELHDKAQAYLNMQKEEIADRRVRIQRLYLQHLEQLCRRSVVEGKIAQAREARQQVKLTERAQAADSEW